MKTPTTPREIDMALAAKHHELDKANQQIAYSNGDMFDLAGAKYAYHRIGHSQKRVPINSNGQIMTLEEAIAAAEVNVAALKAYKDDPANQYIEKSSYGDYHGTHWTNWKGVINSYDSDSALKAFDKRAERIAVAEGIKAEIEALQDLYTGWSRFFVVTSSAGHIHSSMHCSTCYYTTTYGWLPELSGKTEAEAVEAHGPALCSVCFPSAPVNMVGGKLTAAKAAKAAA